MPPALTVDYVHLMGYVRLDPDARERWLGHRVKSVEAWNDWSLLEMGRFGAGSSDLSDLMPEEVESLSEALGRNNREIFEDWADKHNRGGVIYFPPKGTRAEAIMGNAWDPDGHADVFETTISKENWEQALVLFAAIRSAESFKKNDAQIDHVSVGEAPGTFDLVQLHITAGESHLGRGYSLPLSSTQFLTQLEEAKALVIRRGHKVALAEELDAVLEAPAHNFLDAWLEELGMSEHIEDLFGTDIEIMRILGAPKKKPRSKSKRPPAP